MSTYNDAVHLAESVDSVLSQVFTDFEFVIVNDGSPDLRTAEILAEYARRDPRIRVITKQNAGLTKALIDGCAAAKGQYIARLDVGDVMTPDRLRRQVEVLEQHPEVVFVSCWTEFCGPEWEPLWTEEGPVATSPSSVWLGNVLPDTPGENLKAGPTCHPSVMMRAEAYHRAGGYRWQFYYGQDWDLWYRLAEQGWFALVPAALYRVRMLPQGVSSHNHERQMQIGQCSFAAFGCRRQGIPEDAVLARAAAIRPGRLNRRAGRSRRGAGDYFVGEILRRNGDRRCRQYLWRAVRADTLAVGRLFRLLQSLLLPRARVAAGGGAP